MVQETMTDRHTEESRRSSLAAERLHAYLLEATRTGDPRLFLDLIDATLSRGGSGSAVELAVRLEALRDSLVLDGAADDPLPLIDAALERTRTRIAGEMDGEDPHPLSDDARTYLWFLRSGDREGARRFILSRIEGGDSIRDLYLQIFQPVQYEVGRLWQCNIMSVAEEHFCTAVTQSIMLELYPRIITTPRRGNTIVSCCVGQELHELGIRMVCDFFELDGWDTWYLGAGVDIDRIVEGVTERTPQILALSVTMSYHLDEAARVIREVKRRCVPSPLIMIGGRPFNAEPTLWQRVGADLTARDASEAIAVATDAITTHAAGEHDAC